MTARQEILDFYSRPTVMTVPGRHGALVDALPRDVAPLVRAIQGLVLHEYAASAYGVAIPDQRKSESHIRPVEELLDQVLAHDARPLFVPRSPAQRLVGTCRHFTALIVAVLRAKGVPARARCGFGSYFNPPYFEEHIVCEYWNAAEARWVLVDTQFDEVWQAQAKIDHDVLDVPRDRFLIAADAWIRCRAAE